MGEQLGLLVGGEEPTAFKANQTASAFEARVAVGQKLGRPLTDREAAIVERSWRAQQVARQQAARQRWD